jgi:hypothetical protein
MIKFIFLILLVVPTTLIGQEIKLKKIYIYATLNGVVSGTVTKQWLLENNCIKIIIDTLSVLPREQFIKDAIENRQKKWQSRKNAKENAEKYYDKLIDINSMTNTNIDSVSYTIGSRCIDEVTSLYYTTLCFDKRRYSHLNAGDRIYITDFKIKINGKELKNDCFIIINIK